jgi:hypothetical protein
MVSQVRKLGVSKFSMAIAVPSSQGASSKELANASKTAATVKQPPFTIDQQLKFLHLQAEAESLLQQLKLMKQQRELR